MYKITMCFAGILLITLGIAISVGITIYALKEKDNFGFLGFTLSFALIGLGIYSCRKGLKEKAHNWKRTTLKSKIYTYFYLFLNSRKMKIPNRFFQYFEKHPVILFCLLLGSLYFILYFHHILFLRPQGIHFIRQTDGLSFVSNYYKNGFHFFEPQVFNLQSTDGKAASEFPILYYLTALSYLLFGEHEFMLRLLTLSIVSFGFFFLFKLLILLLKDIFYAIVFCFLFA